MTGHINPRREAARSFFALLEKELRADEVIADRRCVRMLIEKAETEQAAKSRKRFDSASVFRTRVLYAVIDRVVTTWCQRRELRTDAFSVFRYEGSERGPTQHETAIGPSMPQVERFHERIAAAAPELASGRHGAIKAPTKALSPQFRFQHPLPFGAAGDAVYGGGREDLEVGIFRAAAYAASGGDVSRGWRYDCGLFIFYGAEPPRAVLGEALLETWSEVRERIWEGGRTWVILL